MKFNESLLRSKIKENLEGIENDLDREGKATAIAEALNFFDGKRDWVTKINRDDIISLITNSPSQEVLCERIIDKVNATPFSKSLKESKKKKSESKKLNESLTKSLNEKKLEEGTSNFYDQDNIPLLIFLTEDEFRDIVDYDSGAPKYSDFDNDGDYCDAFDTFKDTYYDKYYKGVCILTEEDYDNLVADINKFNSETRAFDYEDGEDTWTLEDIELKIEPGYYEGSQIYCENEKNFDYLSDGVKEEQLNRFNAFLDEMQKKYGLTKLSVAYRMSNGETGYNIQEELKNIKEAKDDLQTKATKMMSVKKYYIDMAWKNGKTWKTEPMTLDEIAKSVDTDKVTEQQFVDMMSDNIKRRKDAKNLTKAEIVKLYDYMDGKWQSKDVLWSINGKTNESLKEHISSKDLKDNDILDILGIEEEQRKVKNVGSYIKQYRQLLDKGYDEPKFEIYLKGDDAYYKKLGKVVDNSKDLVVIDTHSKEENLKEGYYDYMDKDYADILDKDVDVYDIKQFVLNDTNNEFRTHYSDEFALITCPNGKGCVVDYEAVGQDFDTLDSEIEFGIEENKDSEYTDENGTTHKTIRIFASHILTTTPKEVMEKAPKKTMKYRDFFRKYKYNDRCANNFSELVSYIKKNGGLQEGCHSKKKRKLKEGYLGQTLEDFFYDCVDPEVIGTVSLWGDNDEIYSGDYDGAIDEYGSNEFIEFDCGTGKVVINVDTSEEYQVTDYFIDVQDFVDCFNGDDIEVYDINTGETLFSGDRYELPDDVAEKIFVSFDAPDFISINIEEDGDRFDDDDDFDESLNEEALGKVQEVTKAVDCDGNEFYVKPIWRGDRLAKLVDKDGNQTRVEIADLRQYYDLYDQDGDVISRWEDYIYESLNEDRVYKDYVIEYNKPYNYYIIRTQGGSVVGYINGTKAKNRKDIETIIDNGSYEKSDDYIKNENLKEDWVKHFKNFDYYPNEDEDKFIVIKTDGNGKTLDKFEIDVTTYEDAKKYIKDNLLEKVVNEDTVKQGGKWVNKGNTGETHGEFKTKKEADKQRKAMFVNKKPNAKWGK